MKMINKKLLIIFLIVTISIGFSAISSVLSISGNTSIARNTWDVHFENIQVTSGSVTSPTPIISNNDTTVTYNIVLTFPGDYYEFTVDAVNDGTIDAMIDSIDSKLNGTTITTLPDYLKYSVTYSDGVEIETNHELLHGTTETYKVRVEYSTDINANQLPQSDQSLSLQFSVEYKQKDASATHVGHIVVKYVIGKTTSTIGQAIPSGLAKYNTASEAMAAFSNRPFYLKHITQNDIITESYAEFVISSDVALANPELTAGTYSLRGGINESAETIKPVYEANKAALINAYGSSNCTDNSTGFTCHVSGLGVGASIYQYGTVNIYESIGAGPYGRSWGCTVQTNGNSSCAND